MVRRSSSRHGASRRTGRAPARRAAGRPRRSHSRIKTVWVPLLVVGSVLAMGVYLYPLIKMDYASQREVERLEGQLASLQDRNEDLREQVDRLKTPEGVEEAARESLGYVKPGENAYVVVEADGSGEETGFVVPVAETVFAAEPAPWWQRWLDRIFGVGS